MNLAFQRKVDRIVGTLLCRGMSFFPRRKRLSKTIPEKILVILLSEMGSLVLAYPMFTQIKRRYPGATIHVLLFEQNLEILEILNVIPKENILTINSISMKRFILDCLRVLQKMRRIKFDAIIDCELFSRISAIFSFLSGAPIRVGFHPYTQEGLYRGSFINRPVMYNPYHHVSQQFLTMVEALDSKTTPTAKRIVPAQPFEAPSISFEESKIQSMTERLHCDFPVVKDKKLILLYPGGGILPIRAWPLDYYCRLSERFISDGYAVAIIGMKADKALAKTILSRCGNLHCIDLTGYTKNLRELMALFYRACLLITNDGGPGQFAALTPIPTIIFYGPETPALYGTLSKKAFFFYRSLSCSPCLTAYNHRNSPCDGDNWCLKGIHPDQVYAKAMEFLENGSKS